MDKVSEGNNKRVAKNTIFLYSRMIVLLLVQLYASRVVLNALGFDEYGLYSIVGSVVIFLGFVNISMSAASQRFLAFAHGKGDTDNLKKTFNSVFLTQLIIAVLILVVAETGGTIYIQYFLKVEDSLKPVAHIVFQCSLLSFLTKTVSVPYTASLIANERMNVFAVLSLLEGGLQLSAALALTLFQSGRLVVYAALMASSVIAVQVGYGIYCRRNFPECKVDGGWNRESVKEIFAYSGWNLMGSFSSVAIDQGVNMILNSFFGVVVNAARGIAFQVSGGIASLSGNFQQAINPQIVKSYASEDYAKMHSLIINGTRFCFFLLLILSMPVYFNIDGILKLWLEEVPPLTGAFCRLVIINSLLTALSGCLLTAAMATGNIKRYQIIVASINISNLPLSYLALCVWRNPLITVVVMIIISMISFAARLILSSRLVGMSIRMFLKNIVRFIMLPTFLAAAFCEALRIFMDGYAATTGNLFICIIAMFLIVTGCLTVSGTKAEERHLAYSYIRKKI